MPKIKWHNLVPLTTLYSNLLDANFYLTFLRWEWKVLV